MRRYVFLRLYFQDAMIQLSGWIFCRNNQELSIIIGNACHLHLINIGGWITFSTWFVRSCVVHYLFCAIVSSGCFCTCCVRCFHTQNNLTLAWWPHVMTEHVVSSCAQAMPHNCHCSVPSLFSTMCSRGRLLFHPHLRMGCTTCGASRGAAYI